MNIFEYPHIQEAIQNVRNDLKYKHKACVVATMGIGKSAIATKIMIENANTSIIFAAPKQIIIEQIKMHLQNMGYHLEKDFLDLKFYTYAHLHYMIKNGQMPEYNLLICDEFHAISNKKQYQSIKKLFTYSDDKNYLGLSATPILQWEYEKLPIDSLSKTRKRVNMAEVLYDNNISYTYSLENALEDALFPYPIYHEFYILDNKDSRQTAVDLLKQRKVKNITEDMISSLASKLEKEASLTTLLKKYICPKNAKIMYYCKSFNDLLEKESLLKELFPNLQIYKTACRFSKKENERNIAEFRSEDHNEENSKVLLSIRQVNEGFHTDGKMQLVFGNKTNTYRDFIQKFGRGFSLGNKFPVEVLDFGGNLTRIGSLNFLNFKNKLEQKTKKQELPHKQNIKIQYSGNMSELNTMINKMVQNVFVSKKEKTNIYYERMISSFGQLKDQEEKFKDGTYVKDWYKEMLYIASTELHFLKQNKDYQISKENMYIIETLAYLDNFEAEKKLETEDKKRDVYYKKALDFKDYLPKNDDMRFRDGTYMSTWYQLQKKKVRTILKSIETKEDYLIDENNFELLQWFNMLHTDLKILWTDKVLGFQKKEQKSPLYKQWQSFSEDVENNVQLPKNKKQCEALDQFRMIDEFYNGIQSRTEEVAAKNFPYAKLNMDSIKKHLVLKR